jgi:HEAT repeat protein
MAQQHRKFSHLLLQMGGRDAQVAEDAFIFIESNMLIYKTEIVAACVDLQQEGVLCWLLELLSSTGDPQVVPVIASFLNDPREPIRSSAREWLIDMDIREARIAIYKFDTT